MKILLLCNKITSGGQDFRARAVAKKLSVYPITCIEGVYVPGHEMPIPSLFISFNSDSESDLEFISQYSHDIPLVVHHQLQPSYIDPPLMSTAKKILSRAERVIVPARFMVDLVKQEFKAESVMCIRNGVDPSYFSPADDIERIEFKRELGIPHDSLVVSVVSRLTYAKGWQILKKVASLLPHNIFLVVRSYPRYRNRLNQIEGNSQIRIQEENYKTRLSLPTRYSDVLLILSLSEVAPLVGIEALASGVPILTTACTPFYYEISKEGLCEPHIISIDLPPSIKSTARPNLKLTDDQASFLAIEVISKLKNMAPPSLADRLARSRLTIKARMTEESMLSEFWEVYNSVEFIIKRSST